MAGEREALHVLVRLLEYPDGSYSSALARCRTEFHDGLPALEQALREFAASIGEQDVGALQELFTQTFDFDPRCCLDMGWHLFGENYDRGSCLAELRQQLERYSVPEGSELPDHLPTLLLLLDRQPPDQGRELAARYVAPAVDRLRAALAERTSPYVHLLAAVRAGLASWFAVPPAGGVA